jgi:hypothetical protein
MCAHIPGADSGELAEGMLNVSLPLLQLLQLVHQAPLLFVHLRG